MPNSPKRSKRELDITTKLDRFRAVSVVIAAYELQMRSAASHAPFPSASALLEISPMSEQDKQDYTARILECEKLKAWFKDRKIPIPRFPAGVRLAARPLPPGP